MYESMRPKDYIITSGSQSKRKDELFEFAEGRDSIKSIPSEDPYEEDISVVNKQV